MFKNIIAILGLGVIAAFVGNIMLDHDKELNNIAAKHSLSAEETVAFKACVGDLSGHKLKYKDGSSISKIPREVCVCQAKQMVRIFKPGQYSSHGNIIKLSARNNSSSKQLLEPKDLRSPSNVKATFVKLQKSVMRCVSEEKISTQKHQRINLKNDCKNPKSSSEKSMCRALKDRGNI